MIQEAVRPEELRSTLRDVLSANGIPEDVESGGEIPDWLPDFMANGGGTLLLWLFRGAIVIAICIALFFLVRAVWRYRRRDSFDDEVSQRTFEQVRLRVAELRKDALAAEASGDLALALRLYLFALVVGLGENGELEFRPAWTNRELIARGTPKLSVRQTLTALLDDLDPKTFGRVPAAVEDVRRMELLCDDLLGKYAA